MEVEVEVVVEVEVPHPLLATIASPRVPLNVGANPTLSASARLQTPVTTSTQARLTLNDFSPGGDGGSPSECDDKSMITQNESWLYRQGGMTMGHGVGK